VAGSLSRAASRFFGGFGYGVINLHDGVFKS